MDAFYIEKRKISLKLKARGGFRDISGWNFGNFSCLGQEKNRAGFFQVRDIFSETFHESFIAIRFSLVIETQTKS